jgi:hypothetical protein
MRSGLFSASVAAAASLIAGGCAGAALPQLPEIPLDMFKSDIVGSPTEVYARVARGAMACWFGTDGPLRSNYIYHAEAAPPSQGGKAEIVIHEHDRTSENPRGLRAYRIAIVPREEISSLAVENLKLPEALAASMEKDVRRWAAGGIGCAEADVQWGTEAPPGAPEPPKKPELPKKKPGDVRSGVRS